MTNHDNPGQIAQAVSRGRKARAIVLLAAISLASCTSVSVKDVKGPDGKLAYALECSALEDCYGKAGEICPVGYTVIDRASSTVGVPASGGTIMVPQLALVISCK